MRRLLPILGGTFDPVHHGHLRAAFEIARWCEAPVRLLPSHRPAHRTEPRASAAERRTMLELATQAYAELAVDDRELRRDGPTYSFDTLAALRAEEPDAAIAFILGADAFDGLDRWYRWEAVTALTHFIVVPRPGHGPRRSAALQAWLTGRETTSLARLRAEPAGRVIVAPTTPLAISATALRALLAAGGDPAFLVPEAVRAFLQERAIYGAQGATSSDDGRPSSA